MAEYDVRGSNSRRPPSGPHEGNFASRIILFEIWQVTRAGGQLGTRESPTDRGGACVRRSFDLITSEGEGKSRSSELGVFAGLDTRAEISSRKARWFLGGLK